MHKNPIDPPCLICKNKKHATGELSCIYLERLNVCRRHYLISLQSSWCSWLVITLNDFSLFTSITKLNHSLQQSAPCDFAAWSPPILKQSILPSAACSLVAASPRRHFIGHTCGSSRWSRLHHIVSSNPLITNTVASDSSIKILDQLQSVWLNRVTQ